VGKWLSNKSVPWTCRRRLTKLTLSASHVVHIYTKWENRQMMNVSCAGKYSAKCESQMR